MKYKKREIVGNISAPKTRTELTHIAFNVRTNMVRNDTMEGRAYKVCPMVMILEGVHNGSQGKLYYPANEISKSISLWDHKPVVVYHPTVNGVGVSACDPRVITSHKVGVILNTAVDRKGPDGTMRLTAEAWIENDRAAVVDKRIPAAIRNQKTMELSTGLFMDKQLVDNEEWKGEPYEAVARNFRPDHLALLPDKEGACSTRDGAGFIRNDKAKYGDEEDPNDGDEDEDELEGRDATIEPEEDEDSLHDESEGDTHDMGLMDNVASPITATKTALGSSNDLEDHIRARGDKVPSSVAGLVTKAASFASRAASASGSSMAAVYHTKAAKTYDMAHIANYRAKGPVKTSIMCAKCGTAHYDAADAHKGMIGNGGPGSGPQGGRSASAGKDKNPELASAARDASAKAYKSGKVIDHIKAANAHESASKDAWSTMSIAHLRESYKHISEARRIGRSVTGNVDHYEDATSSSMPMMKSMKKMKGDPAQVMKVKQNAGDSGADGQDADISESAVGVTKYNPTKDKKKYAGDQEQKISVMTRNGGPGSGPQGGGSDLKAAYKEAVSKGDKQKAESIAQQMWGKTNYQSSKNPLRNMKYTSNGGPGSGPHKEGGGAAPGTQALGDHQAFTKGQKVKDRYGKVHTVRQHSLGGSSVETTGGRFHPTKIYPVGNGDNSFRKTNMKLNKNEQVEALIENQDSVWTEDEQDFLLSLNDKQVSALYEQSLALNKGIDDDEKSTKKLGNDQGDGKDQSEDGETDDCDGTKTLGGSVEVGRTDKIAKNGKMPTQFIKKKKADMGEPDEDDNVKNESEEVEEYIANAPEGIREVLQEGIATQNREKRAAIKSITDNAANEFSKEELANMPLRQLRSMAKIAQNSASDGTREQSVPNRMLNFGGQAHVIDNEDEGEMELLAMPTMNWGEEDKPTTKKRK